jgi:hypothetical protein
MACDECDLARSSAALAILQHIVHFRHAVIDLSIEPLELVVGVGDLAL